MSTPRRLNYAHVMVVIANAPRRGFGIGWRTRTPVRSLGHDKDEGFLCDSPLPRHTLQK